jgi:ATP synthase protein I
LSKQDTPWKALSLGSMIGIDLAFFVLIGYWIGNKVDNWLGTGVLWRILGVVLGLTAGILSIIPIINRYYNDDTES